MSELEIARLAGQVSFYLMLVGAAIGLGFYLARKEPAKRFVWWPIVVLAILLAASWLGQIMPQTIEPAVQSNVESATPVMRVEKNIGRDVSGQNIVLTPEIVSAHQSIVRKSFLSELQKNGVAPLNAKNAIVKSDLVSINQRKMIRTKSELTGTVSILDFAGIENGKEINVTCIQEGAADLKYADSPCEDKVQETFGSSPIELVNKDG